MVELTPNNIIISLDVLSTGNSFNDWIELNKELTTIYQLIVTNQDYPVHESGLVWFPMLVRACSNLELSNDLSTQISKMLIATK